MVLKYERQRFFSITLLIQSGFHFGLWHRLSQIHLVSFLVDNGVNGWQLLASLQLEISDVIHIQRDMRSDVYYAFAVYNRVNFGMRMHWRSLRRIIAKLRVNQPILFVQTVSFVFLVGGWLEDRLNFHGLRGLPPVDPTTLVSEGWRIATGRAMLYRVLVSLSIQIDLRQVIVDLTFDAARNALRPRPLNILVNSFFTETLSL